MADNTRDSNSYIYSGPGPVINKYGDYSQDMQICAYCGYQFAGCYVHRFSVTVTTTRNGKKRLEMWRCNECMQDMRSYKPPEQTI